MNIMVLDKNDDIEMLRELGSEWAAFAELNEFALPIDINIGLNTMKNLQLRSDGDVLVCIKNKKLIGFIGLNYKLNHVGPGMIVNECCFYAKGCGKQLIVAAEKLAKSKGCNFSTLNASKVAGDWVRSGKLYNLLGYEPFEVSHIKVL